MVFEKTSRTQWLGIANAPSMQTLNAHARIGDKSGVGGLFFHDKNGFQSKLGFKKAVKNEDYEMACHSFQNTTCLARPHENEVVLCKPTPSFFDTDKGIWEFRHEDKI